MEEGRGMMTIRGRMTTTMTGRRAMMGKMVIMTMAAVVIALFLQNSPCAVLYEQVQETKAQPRALEPILKTHTSYQHGALP